MKNRSFGWVFRGDDDSGQNTTAFFGQTRVSAWNARRWWATQDSGYTLLAVSFLVSFLLRFPYYQHDFIFIDEAWWANGGKVWLQGNLLYRDIWLDKNPPIFLFCGILFRLFGVHMDAIHLGSLGLVFLISFLLFCIGTTFWNRTVGGIAALLYALSSTTYYIPRIIGMNTETLMVVFTSAAIFFFLLGLSGRGSIAFLICGTLSAFGFLTKPVAITQALLFAFFLLVIREGPFLIRLKKLLWITIGYGIGLAFLGAYLYANGILGPWWEQAIVYGFRYVGHVPFDSYLWNILRKGIAFLLIYLWLFLLMAAVFFRKRPLSDPVKVVALWIGTAFLGALIGRRLYANYFLQVIPSLSLVGAIGLHQIWAQKENWKSRKMMQASLACFLLVFGWFHTRTAFYWWYWFSPPGQEQAQWWDMHRENDQLRRVADYIKSRTKPQDTVFIWGSKSQIYFLAERGWAIPSMDYDVSDDVPPSSGTQKVRLETIEKLKSRKPTYIIDVQHKARIEQFPFFKRFIQQFYFSETQIGPWQLYRLKEPVAGEPQQPTEIGILSPTPFVRTKGRDR